MSVKQISVFIENEKGALAEVTKFIAENHINLKALSIADTPNFGILRLITDNPEEAREMLKSAGYTAKATSVLAVALDDTPGSMASILSVLFDGDISVEYTYAFLSNVEHKAYMVCRVDDNDKATQVLAAAGIAVLNQEDIFNK